MLKRDELTIVVNSCDKYDDMWFPFFRMLKLNWESCNYRIVLNTESKTYSYDGLNIDCLRLYTPEQASTVSWSDRMIETLKHISSEYIFVFCDDHFIVSKVDEERFQQSLNILKKHKKISCLSYSATISPDENTKWFDDFGVWKMNKYCRINLCPSVWRTKKFRHILKKGEDIWEAESKGTERALWDFSYYCRYKTGAVPIIDAPFHPRRGYGLIQGKWCWNSPELFKRYGIPMDFSKRGIMTKDECIGIVEKNNAGDIEIETKIHINAVRNFFFQIKRRIPVKIRVFLSKIKRRLIK